MKTLWNVLKHCKAAMLMRKYNDNIKVERNFFHLGGLSVDFLTVLKQWFEVVSQWVSKVSGLQAA